MSTTTLHETKSLWAETVSIPRHPSLEADIETDVCIIGAGIAGLSTAYALATSGKSVVVLDQATIGAGDSGFTSAHLSNAPDPGYSQIEHIHGAHAAKLVAQSHSMAIDAIAATAVQENIACDFERVDGYLFCGSEAEGNTDVLDRELQAAWRAGLSGVERLPRAPLPFESGPCLRYPKQAQFHPLKYLAGLAAAIERRGGKVFAASHVKHVQGGARAEILTEGEHKVLATAAVVTTHTPVSSFLRIHTKQAPYRSYVIGMRISEGSVAPGLFWDTDRPYHYIRQQKTANGEILLVGGQDHKTGQGDPDEAVDRLVAWARERFPMAKDLACTWSGQIVEPFDGLAFIGHSPGDEPNVYLVTGESGNGMTYGTIAGMLIGDLILGKENPWASLYDPSRATLRAAGEFARDNLNVAAQYAEFLTPGEMESAKRIPAGEGAIIRRGVRKLAVYRDKEGVLHEFSALCPHLDCIVQWNTLERSWDCPCHGSRFSAMGEVMAGPALSRLSPAPAAKDEKQNGPDSEKPGPSVWK